MGADTAEVTQTPQRYHWLNVLVGVLDGAFHLTDDEQYGVANVVRGLLDRLRIPERGVPTTLPLAVVQEMYSGLYSQQIDSSHTQGTYREVRPVVAEDAVVSLEAWRLAVEDLILTAYPDLDVTERLLLTKTITDLLAAIGVPNRAAAHFPPAVVDAHHKLDT